MLSDKILEHLAEVFSDPPVPSAVPTRRAGRQPAGDFEVATEVGVQLELPPIGGRFKVISPLGSGGMGAVYRALDLQTGREVAVKVPHLLSSFVDRRFELEVDAIAAVVCPATIGFVARGSADEPFVAMEFVRGIPLGRRLSEGAFPRSEAIAVGRRLAAALAAVHLSGWVHRDVKPGNIVLTEDRTIRLVDFGLARLVDGPGAGTETGQILGTLGYLAPEQFGAKRIVDPRTDVFALGCVLFECLTGKNAFTRSLSDVVTGRWAPENHPKLDVRGAGLDAPVAAVVEELVQNDPAKRPEDGLAALELLLRLDQTAAAHLGRARAHAAEVQQVIRASLRRPVAITGAAGAGKSSAGHAAAILLAEILAPATVVHVRCNPPVKAMVGGHALLLERVLRVSGYEAAARILAGMGVTVEAGAQEPSLVLLVDDATFADEESIRWMRTLASVGLARVIATVRPGAEVPEDFERVDLLGPGLTAAADLDELPASHRKILRLFATFGTSFELASVTNLAIDRGVPLHAPILEDLTERGILLHVGRGGMAFTRASHWEHVIRSMTPEEVREGRAYVEGLERVSGHVPLEVTITRRATGTLQ